jgi:hypothetical protein
MSAPIQAASVVFALLYLKYLVCNVITGRLKRQLGGGPPEDRRENAPAPDEALKAKYERWSNICNNDTENLLLGCIAMFMSAIVVSGTGNNDAHNVSVAFSALWGMFRFAHTLIYARGSAGSPRVQSRSRWASFAALFKSRFWSSPPSL